jgi:hypothetical protein
MKNIVFILATLFLVSCGAPVLKTVYTNPASLPAYKKILVIAIMPEGGSSHEREMENSVIRSLAEKGLEGISYADAISIYDTCQPCLDAFYFSLEEKNIDGILTISKLALFPAVAPTDWKAVAAAPFYLDYIWKYKVRQQTAVEPGSQKYIWESILFDLHGLETNTVLQSKYAATSFQKRKVELILQEITDHTVKHIASNAAPKEKPKQAF